MEKPKGRGVDRIPEPDAGSLAWGRDVARRLVEVFRRATLRSDRAQAILYLEAGKIGKPEKLFGREMECNLIDTLLDVGERVLLHGMGGTGKTALAATLADRRIEANKGPFLWLQPNSDDDADTILDSLAQPLATKEEKQKIDALTGAAKSKEVGDLLSNSDVSLLVLDDVWNGNALWHVVRAVPETIPVLVK